MARPAYCGGIVPVEVGLPEGALDVPVVEPAPGVAVVPGTVVVVPIAPVVPGVAVPGVEVVPVPIVVPEVPVPGVEPVVASPLVVVDPPVPEVVPDPVVVPVLEPVPVVERPRARLRERELVERLVERAPLWRVVVAAPVPLCVWSSVPAAWPLVEPDMAPPVEEPDVPPVVPVCATAAADISSAEARGM